MATVPTPATQTAGLVVPAATINGQGNLATYLAGRVESGGARRPVALLTQTVAQSIANSTTTAITFDAESFDYDNGHSTVSSTSVYTVQTAGVYEFVYGASFVTNATGYRQAWIRQGGGTAHLPTRASVPSAGAGGATGVTGSAVVSATAGTTFELCVIQTSTVALNTSVTAPDQSSLAVYWLST